MQYRMRKPLLVALMLSIPVVSHAQDLEFKGLKPGIEFSDPDHRFICKNDASPIADVICSLARKETIAGTSADSVNVFLVDQHISSVSVVFKNESFETIKAALLEKYGPAPVTHNTLVNRMGARFNNETLKWTEGSDVMTLERYSGNVDNGLLEIHNAESVEKFLERKRRQTTLNSGDL